ncbi:TrbI F-type domain-containing protein [Citrobacter freundii]|uniref:TrbI F-type domain-containing protein n=1 Tax=Enterobacteriaceae TaxID=543 RepID=UPI00345C196B
MSSVISDVKESELIKYALLIMVSCLVSIIVLFVLWSAWLKPPVIVSFDIKSTTNKFLLQSAKLTLTDEQRKDLVQRFNKALTDTLADYAAENNVVVIVQPAAVSGIQDVTPQIRTQLSKAMSRNQ